MHHDEDVVRRDIDAIREDVATLRALIDAALDRGVRGDDFVLKACADELYKRRRQLDELERGHAA
jgi:hypothetical protein